MLKYKIILLILKLVITRMKNVITLNDYASGNIKRKKIVKKIGHIPYF